MKTPSKPMMSRGAAGLLVAAIAAGSLALLLHLPLPVVLAVLVLLALRLGVMAAAIEEPSVPGSRPDRPGAPRHRPALHGVRG